MVKIKIDEEEAGLLAVDPTKDEVLRAEYICLNAIYRDSSSEIDEYADNPLILALPPFDSVAQICGVIDRKCLKPCPVGCRRWTPERKVAGLGLIRGTISTTSHLPGVIDTIYGGLRARYARCNPLVDRQNLAEIAYRLSQNGEPTVISDDDETHADCFAVFGLSGMGKTTLIKIVLSMLPPIIRHERNPIGWYKQVVYIFVTCPHNGSLATLLHSILVWFDHHLKTHYIEHLGARANEAQYMAIVIYALGLHLTGLLVIDDIEFALRNTETLRTIDWIANLLSANVCMVCVIATGDAKPVIRKRIRLARRYLSRGEIDLDPLEPNDPDWLKMSDAIIRIDFFPEEPPDKEAVRRSLCRFAAGDTAIAKLAWTLTQHAGARLEDQRYVTPEFIELASRPAFSTIDGLLEALRTKDYEFLSTVVDAATRTVDLRIQDVERERAIKQFYGEYKARESQNIFLDAIEALMNLGISRIRAEEVIERLLRTEPDLSARSLVQRALAELDELGGQSGNAPETTDQAKKGKSKARSEKSKPAAGFDAYTFNPTNYLDPSSG